MRLEGERWRTLVSTVRLGKDEYRVVRPARPLKHAPLFEWWAGVECCVDKAAALEITMAWAFAMRSPRTIVYLPLKQSDSECSWSDGPFLDLVLVHHSLGLRLSKWKEIRGKLRGGRPHTVVCQGFGPEPDYDRRYHRENRDLLRGEIVGETVFVVGSAPAFHFGGHELRELVEDGPRRMHEEPGVHCCAEVTENLRYWNWLHVEYCEDHRVHA
ncbi:hypothetical protein JNUCC0626_42115 [Lentzea sp. JNUCC 0626]|uniref:hypothetical protein n=1 Tax=Lentzea sp. JNUCC 0626 TaxID=3367513 RepID=UPI003749069E